MSGLGDAGGAAVPSLPEGAKGLTRNGSCLSPLVLYWAHLAVHWWRDLLSFSVRETEKIPLILT